jgi:hypothetical protein
MSRAYAWLLRFYPAAWRRRFGAPMRQAFDDMCRERRREGRPMAGFLAWTFAETAFGAGREQLRSVEMRNLVADPRAALLLALLLALPGALLLSVAWLEIEPLNGLLATAFRGAGLVVLIVPLALLPVALGFSLWPALRRRADWRGALPNLAAACAILLLMAPLLYVAAEEFVNCKVRAISKCD